VLRNKLDVIKYKNEEVGKQLNIARIVALVVLICLGVQLYTNLGWRNYMPNAAELKDNLISKTNEANQGLIDRIANT